MHLFQDCFSAGIYSISVSISNKRHTEKMVTSGTFSLLERRDWIGLEAARHSLALRPVWSELGRYEIGREAYQVVIAIRCCDGAIEVAEENYPWD